MRSSELESPPSAIRRLATVVAVLGMVYGICFAWFTLFVAPEQPFVFVDLDYYRAALDTLIAGQPLYPALPYPPVAVVVIAGLGGLPVELGNRLWTAATLIMCLALAGTLAKRSLEARGERGPSRWNLALRGSLTALALLASTPMVSQLTSGQVTLLIITLAFLDVSGVVPRKAQGVLVGIAGAIKLTPLIFIPYFLVTGQRRQAAVASVSFGLTTAVGFALLPKDSVFFWSHLGKSDQFGDPARFDNLSISASLARWLPAGAHQPVVWIGLGLVVALLAMARARRHFLAGEHMEAALTVGASSVVLSPITWPHYLVWVVLVGLWLVTFRRSRHLLLGLGVCVVYSLPYALLVLPHAVVGNRGAMAAVDLAVLIPILIGVCGLPRRPAERAGLPPEPAVGHPQLVPTAG